jgi:AraC family transcriptional regulator, ethanolamine operon transcriptional activator
VTEHRARTCDNGRPAQATTGAWVCDDPSLHEQAVKPWELLTSCLSRGQFRHEMRYFSASAFSVYQERFAYRVRLRGQSPPGVIAVAVPIRVPPQTLCWKNPWSTEQMPAINGDALDVLLDAGHEQLVVLVDGALARRELGQERAQRLERLCRLRGLPSTERRVAQLRAFLLALIDLVDASPRVLRNAMAVHSIETDLIRNIAAAVAVPLEEQSAAGSHRARPGRSRLLARALEVVRATNPLDLSIPQLCEAARVDQRSLEYAFRETFDLTPLGFLRLSRLHSARCRLLAADPADMAVRDIAYQEGFYHLGRFASTYRSTFGEYPSATLQRPCPKELETVMAVPLLQLQGWRHHPRAR